MKKAYVGILSGVLALSAVAISAFAAPAGRPVGQQGAQDSSTVEPYQASLDSRAVQGNLSGAVMAGAGNDEVGTEEGLGSELAQPVATMVEPTVETVWGAGYVDSDGDGVCDNLGTGSWGAGYVDSDEDGVCDNLGTGSWGAGYVDSDGDGVCDNLGTGGRGAGYVDSDGDGVCDNLGTGGRLRNGAGARNGRGYGAGRNR